MTARFRKFLVDLADLFWVLPAMLVLLFVAAAEFALAADRRGLPSFLTSGGWLYSGGGQGARTLLGSVASAIIGVAGTIFSITIATLTLASSQMGPRLLRNFVRDRGNQATLGIMLGTFAYCLVVLRTVRDKNEGEFVPSLSLTGGIVLAFACLAVLIYFINHVAGRINVETVVELEHAAVRNAIGRLTATDAPPAPPPQHDWSSSRPVTDDRDGYLQELDLPALADWAARHRTRIRLLLRAGDCLFPDMPIALVDGAADDDAVRAAIRRSIALGRQRSGDGDLEFAIRHLVEVAVRALSPGVNDPNTAKSVLDRLGIALCFLATRHLSTGSVIRDGREVLVVPVTTYDGLCDLMFDAIRRHGADDPGVAIATLEVLARVASVERRPDRLDSLRRHARLVRHDAAAAAADEADRAEIERRFDRFERLHGAGVSAGTLVPTVRETAPAPAPAPT